MCCTGTLAQTNLIANGDFQEGFSSSTGVANGWLPWSNCWSPGTNIPNCAPPGYWNIAHGSDADRAQRVIGGMWNGSGMDGGIVRQVAVTPGTTYDFTFEASFSNVGGGDPRNRSCFVGFDLTGQVSDSTASTINWIAIPEADAWSSFYQTITAAGPTMSVWTRTRIYWADTECYGDFDNFKLYEHVSPFVQISNVDHGSPSDTSVTITWTTDVAATGRVDYGTLGTYGQYAEDLTPTTNHSITISGLSPGTLYNYRVTSAAEGFQTASSPNATFKTGLPPTEGENLDFEATDAQGNPTLAPWVQFGGFDPIHNNMDFNTPAHGGSRMAAVISHWDNAKNMAGLMQRLNVAPGSICVANVWIWTENNTGDPPLSTNVGPGYNSQCRIGIDPTGGTSPTSTSIVWSDWQNSQDWQPPYAQFGYKQITVMASVPATSSVATVFLQAKHQWADAWNRTAFDDVTIQQGAPCSTLGDARQKPLGWLVELTNDGDGLLVTKVEDFSEANGIARYCWVQEDDRSSAMKVRIPDTAAIIGGDVARGCRIAISGNTNRRNLADANWGETEIVASTIEIKSTDNPDPAPLDVTNKALCGGESGYQRGATGANGANNTGLVVRTTGAVKETGISGEITYFVIEDGSGVAAPGSTTGTGIRVLLHDPFASTPEIGSYVTVTGVSYLDVYDPTPSEGRPNGSGDEVLVRAIRTRDAADIQVIK